MRIWTPKKKRSPRTTTIAGRRAAALAVLLAAGAAFSFAAPKTDDFGLIVGTVFRPNGFSFPGVEVRLEATPEPDASGKLPKKLKPQKTVTSPRGEYSFRVPAKPMRYTLSVKAPGYQPMTKSAVIQADERVDVTFLLEVEKK